jgi:chemotaxis protein CheC
MKLEEAEFQLLYEIVKQGIHDSSAALFSMTTGGISLTDPKLRFVPLHLVPGIAGGPEKVVAAIYLGIQGEMGGHLMLLLEEQSARRVVDLMTESPLGTTQTLDQLAWSALAEAGNVCGSSLLNALANRTGLRLMPTIPIVTADMAGAILESVIANLYADSDEVLMVETSFNEVPGHFLLMPDTASMDRLITALAHST